MSTRNRMRWMAIVCAVLAFLVSCAPAATPTPQVVTKVETKVVKETEVVTKVETQVVVVTPTPEPAAPVPDVIKIGYNDALSGWGAAYGLGSYDGIKLGLKQFPTVLGKPIEIVPGDGKAEKSEHALAAERLVQEGVVAALGTSGSSWSMAANEVYDKYGLPSVSNISTNPLVTLNKPYAFRVCFIDPFQGAVLARFAVNELGAKTAAILVDIAVDYPVGLANFFRDEWFRITDDRESLLGYFSLMTGDTDYTAQLTAIKQLDPDVVLIPNEYKEAGLILKQAKDLGLETFWLAGDSTDLPEFLEIAGPAADDWFYFSGHFHADALTGPVAEQFLEAFRAEFGREPDTLSATGYDSYLVLRDAIERAGSVDAEAIRKALSETTDFPGCTGKISLDVNGDAVKQAVVMGFRNGEKYVAATVQP
jgi:branched-chain amino acid transport system substrate-binding protein